MKLDTKIITGLAGTLILGVCAWVLNTTLEIQKEIVEIRIKTENVVETLDKVYEENCPYCVHAAHSSMAEHPLPKLTIRPFSRKQTFINRGPTSLSGREATVAAPGL